LIGNVPIEEIPNLSVLINTLTGNLALAVIDDGLGLQFWRFFRGLRQDDPRLEFLVWIRGRNFLQPWYSEPEIISVTLQIELKPWKTAKLLLIGNEDVVGYRECRFGFEFSTCSI
jgi:hypothetical protein